MMARHARFSIGLSLSLLLMLSGPTLAASLIDQVPRDALGFTLVRNLSQADAKIAKSVSDLRLPLPSPLALIKSLTGIGAGLDSQRDLLLVMLPSENDSRPFHLAVWLPVQDYGELVRSLDGDPERRIAAATVAGEDVLVAHVQDWAVIMDPDGRERLNQMVSDPPPVAQPATEAARLVDQDADVSLVVLAPGIQTAAAWAASARGAVPPIGEPGQNDRARSQLVPLQSGPPPNDNSWRAAWESTQSMLVDIPELKRMGMEAKGFGCSLRLDQAGNAIVKLRVALSQDAALAAGGTEPGKRNRFAAPPLYDGGDFVLSGWAQVSERWAVPLVAPYVRQMAADLATEYSTKVDDSDLAAFRAAAERAVAQTRAFSVLSRPGTEPEGVYTNSFLAVQVASADEFIKQAKAAVDEWNTMLGKTDGAAGLAFEESPIMVDGHDGSQYSIDMAKAVGAGSLPEARQSMERLFGPGGQFRMQCVKVDDTTVLLSIASEDQLTTPIRVIQNKHLAKAAEDGKLQAVTQLLVGESDWRLYLSLDGYNHWLKRQMEAIVGPVIGGPIVRPFPASPPVAAAGGTTHDMVWAEVAVPADTLRGIGQFLHP
jgi:hypothetical protein